VKRRAEAVKARKEHEDVANTAIFSAQEDIYEDDIEVGLGV
jgi:hypothetical protein